MLKNFPVFLIVFSGLLSVKRAVVHNEIESALEVLCSSKLNFQFLEINFQNERTVRLYFIVQVSFHRGGSAYLRAERWRSPAAGSGSEVRADAIARRPASAC